MLGEPRKNDNEKPRTDLLPPRALVEVAKVFGYGAEKYGDWNWSLGKGLPASRVYAAALRHLFAWWSGEDKDQETGVTHLAHAACSVLMLLDLMLRGGIDDRPSRA